MKRVSLESAERLFYPVIPALVMAEHRGRVGGMLAAWWTQLSFKPLLVGVAIAPERYTYKLIRGSGVFGLNLLDFSKVEITPYLGDVSARFMPDKLERAGLSIVKGEVLGAPIVAEAAAAVEAKLAKVVELGDHDLFVGEVVAAYAIEDFQGMWRLKDYKPLMYLGRTRRPGPVRRVYLAARGWDRVELEYAGGELRRFAELRREVLNRAIEIVKSSPTADEAKLKLRELIRSYGLEEDDVDFYLEEALRTLKHGH
ncbi:MAG: flavin reductase family protein [Thermoproteota archaeon]